MKNLFIIFTCLALFFGQLLGITFTVTSNQTFTLDGDYFLRGNNAVFGAYSGITFASNTGSTRNVTLDGAGYSVWCSTDLATATIAKTGTDTVNLTIINCKLYNFDPVHAQANSSGLTIKLGTGCQIIYTTDTTLSRAQNMTVVGQAVINCLGNRLTIPSAGSGYIDLTNTGTLIIKNGILDMQTSGLAGSTGSPLGGVLRLQNLKIFDNVTGGSLAWDYQSASNYAKTEIADTVEVFGRHTTNLSTIYNLNIQSGFIFTVLTNSMFKINPGINIQYNPVVTPDGTNTAATKRHLYLTDYSSVLSLNGCTITTVGTGMAIDRGTIAVDGTVTFSTGLTSDSPSTLELGSAINFDLAPSGYLAFTGALTHNLTTA